MASSTLIPTSLIRVEPVSQASLRQTVCDEVVSICNTLAGLEAIILTGSMARDEASFACDNETIAVRGDSEFLLVFADTVRVPSAHAIEHQRKVVESRLFEHNIRCKICLSPVSSSFLERMVPHIFGYELRRCGRVVWGNQNALERIPEFHAEEIPLEDAVRLLCNRMVELLELVAGPGPMSKPTQYGVVKLCLDMATSYLVFAGAYLPTYRDRLEQIKTLAKAKAVNVPFSLSEFARLVQYSTNVKLSSSDQSATAFTTDFGVSEHFFTEAIQYAHSLLRWELRQLLKLGADVSDEDLLATWAGSQPWTSRLRGWARVLRDTNRQTTRKNWTRWLGLARHTSPRQGVYSAACLLFFRMPRLLKGRHESLQDLNHQLPISMEENDLIEWRSLAALIAQNYHQFLEFTRT